METEQMDSVVGIEPVLFLQVIEETYEFVDRASTNVYPVSRTGVVGGGVDLRVNAWS